MKILAALAFFFFIQTCFVLGQNVEFVKGNFSGKESGLKEALSNIKKGDEFYRAGTFMWYKALENYLKAQEFNPNNAWLNYKIGTCYLHSAFKQNALSYLEKAKTLNPDVNTRLYFYLGRAYHLRMQWNTAIEQFEEYKKRVAATGEENMGLDPYKKIAECRNGIELMKDTLRFSKLPDSLRYKIENMGASVNSEYPDYRPVISADEAVLIFTARRNNTTGGGMDPYDGKFYEDIYISNNEKSVWSESKNLGDPINTSNQHDATCGISVDGQKLYIYLDDTYNGSGNIYECKLDGRNWSEAQKMPDVINSRYHESSASPSPDGKTIYFCSENLQENKGHGIHDIFRVTQITKDGKTEWSEAENLGTTINTPYDERTVFMHPDGKTLYFSSEGHNSMGGYDMFKSVYNDSTKKWSTPLNLGYPVNTPDDDVDYVVSASGKHAYYASIRPGGFGEKDIYMITLPADTTVYLTLVKGTVMDESKNPVAARIDIIDTKTGKVISTQYSNSATGKFLVSLPSGKNYKMKVTAKGYYDQEKDFNIPKGEKYKELNVDVIMKRKEQMVTIEGDVQDESGKPLTAKIEIVNNATGEVIARTTADNLGKYLSKLQAGKNYGMVVSKEGYLFESINLDIPPDKEYMKIPPIKLKKIEAGKNIVLNNIFFDFDRATLRPDSKPELDRVATVLKDNPSMKIEISGHTDSKGSATYNLRLSESRAKSVVDYLIASGIDKTKLAYKGYGFLKPIASNDTEEGRQTNRRTEFKVLEIDPNAKVSISSPVVTAPVETIKKLPERIAMADKNKDGRISTDEITMAIDSFFDGSMDYTFEKINGLIDFYFEQE